MSYEGSIQFLCLNGHVVTFNCYNAPDFEEFHCAICGSVAAAEKHIDETNGSNRKDYWPRGLVKVSGPVMCECCGLQKEPARYRLREMYSVEPGEAK